MDIEVLIFLFDMIFTIVALWFMFNGKLDSFVFPIVPVASAVLLIPQLFTRDLSIRWILCDMALLIFAWAGLLAHEIQRRALGIDGDDDEEEEDGIDRDGSSGSWGLFNGLIGRFLHNKRDDERVRKTDCGTKFSGETERLLKKEEDLLSHGVPRLLNVIYDRSGQAYAFIAVKKDAEGEDGEEKISVVRVERLGPSDYAFRAVNCGAGTQDIERYNALLSRQEAQKRSLSEKLEDPCYLREHLVVGSKLSYDIPDAGIPDEMDL